MKREDIIRLFQVIGRASLESDLQNSHSGNMACLVPGKSGQTLLAITKTGTQKGDLKPEDIIFISQDKRNLDQASSELVVHREVLRLPGVKASFHAHARQLTLAGLMAQRITGMTPCFKLIDGPGIFWLRGRLPIIRVEKAYGSAELAREVTRCLKQNKVAAVLGHGLFSQGATLLEAFFYAGIANFSGRVIRLLYKIRGKTDKSYPEVKGEALKDFFGPPPAFEGLEKIAPSFPREKVEREIERTRNRVFGLNLAPFFTGSLSVRGGKEIFYTDRASTPDYIGGPLSRFPLISEPGKPEEYYWHWLIIKKTKAAAVLRGHVAEAEAVAWDLLPAERDGVCYFEPVDVEGKFWHPRVPVLSFPVDAARFLNILKKRKAVIIRGGGVWTVGESSLSEALHRMSSIRDSSYYYLGLKEGEV